MAWARRRVQEGRTAPAGVRTRAPDLLVHGRPDVVAEVVLVVTALKEPHEPADDDERAGEHAPHLVREGRAPRPEAVQERDLRGLSGAAASGVRRWGGREGGRVHCGGPGWGDRLRTTGGVPSRVVTMYPAGGERKHSAVRRVCSRRDARACGRASALYVKAARTERLGWGDVRHVGLPVRKELSRRRHAVVPLLVQEVENGERLVRVRCDLRRQLVHVDLELRQDTAEGSEGGARRLVRSQINAANIEPLCFFVLAGRNMLKMRRNNASLLIDRHWGRSGAVALQKFPSSEPWKGRSSLGLAVKLASCERRWSSQMFTPSISLMFMGIGWSTGAFGMWRRPRNQQPSDSSSSSGTAIATTARLRTLMIFCCAAVAFGRTRENLRQGTVWGEESPRDTPAYSRSMDTAAHPSPRETPSARAP